MYTQAETVTEKNKTKENNNNKKKNKYRSVLFSALYSAALTWENTEHNLRAPNPACHGNNLLLVCL